MRDGRSCLRDFVPVTAGGKSFGRLWQHTDITENKRAQEELERRADEMRAVNEELSRFNRAMVGRETRMIELKKEVNELCARLGEPRKYEIGSREQDDQQGRR